MLALKMRLAEAKADLLQPTSHVSYRLHAVTGDENKPWSKYTPNGSLAFDVTNPDAPQLEAGEYLVTLTKVR